MISQLFFSVLFGLISGHYLLKLIRPQTIYRGPDSNQIKKEIIYNQNDFHCYRFVPKSYICPLDHLRKSQ
jgi:hypothetical protein